MNARVVFFTRQECHLCDEAKAVVDAVCRESQTPWQMVDIDTVPALKAKYSEMVPVVTVDGNEVGFWTIDPDALRAALA